MRVAGADILTLQPRQLADFRGRSVGFVFQFASLLSNLRAVDNVALPALIGNEESYAGVYRRRQACWKRSGWAIAGMPIPPSFPAASSDAWPSPAP